MSKKDWQKESVMENSSFAMITIQREAMMEEKGKEESNSERWKSDSLSEECKKREHFQEPSSDTNDKKKSNTTVKLELRPNSYRGVG